MTETYNMTLGLLSAETAGPGAKAILDSAKQGLGFVPNMYAAMANQTGLLESYSFG
ncbi:MAG: carboxymuconolactone decarboxylase family protein, partial [Rhodospirillales bacterium]